MDQARIVMVGLDDAGKTAILYKIKLNENVTTIPTIGFNKETVTPCEGISFTVFDVCGQDKLRPLWRHYYHGTQGLVFVVDSADRERLDEARLELSTLLKHDDIRAVPIVVIANKQDLPGAMSASEVADGLHLTNLVDRKWSIHEASAVSGDGINDAMTELARLVKQSKTSHQ